MKNKVIYVMIITLLFGTVGCTLKGRDPREQTPEHTNEEKTLEKKYIIKNEGLLPISTEETTEKHLFNINVNNVSVISINAYGRNKTISDKKQLSKIINDINDFTYNVVRKQTKPDLSKGESVPPGLGGAMGVQVLDRQSKRICTFTPTDQGGKYIKLQTDTHYIDYYTHKKYKIDFDYFYKLLQNDIDIE